MGRKSRRRPRTAWTERFESLRPSRCLMSTVCRSGNNVPSRRRIPPPRQNSRAHARDGGQGLPAHRSALGPPPPPLGKDPAAPTRSIHPDRVETAGNGIGDRRRFPWGRGSICFPCRVGICQKNCPAPRPRTEKTLVFEGFAAEPGIEQCRHLFLFPPFDLDRARKRPAIGGPPPPAPPGEGPSRPPRSPRGRAEARDGQDERSDSVRPAERSKARSRPRLRSLLPWTGTVRISGRPGLEKT